MIAMVEVIENAPPAERRRLQSALSDRRLQVRLLPERPQGAEWQPPEHIDEDAAHHLQRLRPRPVLMRLGERSVGSRHGRARLLVAVGLEEGAWAEFAIRPPRAVHAPECFSDWG